MRTRDQAQAAVVGGRIHKINHQETLDDLRGITHGMVPKPGVLMPEEWRAVGRFADDESARPFWVFKAKRGQRREYGRIGDELRHKGLVEN